MLLFAFDSKELFQQMKRPPPYFPQTSLNPASDKRYMKFKLAAALLIVLLIAILVGAGIGIYYLIAWLF
jgi:hypothetical protein